MLSSSVKTPRQLVEEMLRVAGVEPTRALVKDEPGRVSWSLRRGSANVLVALLGEGSDGPTRLRVASSLLSLPTDEAARSRLFLRLLELNGSGLANAAFGVVGERVIAVSERPTSGLDAIEVEQMVQHLAAIADTYDDRLVAEFGGKRASDA
jgi:hypothetical protein